MKFKYVFHPFFYDSGKPVGRHHYGERISCQTVDGGGVRICVMVEAVPGKGSGVGDGQHQDVPASGATHQINNTKWQLVG